MYGDDVLVSDQLKRSVVLNQCHCTNDQCLILDHQWLNLTNRTATLDMSSQTPSVSGRLTSGKGYPALAHCVRPVIRSYLQ